MARYKVLKSVAHSFAHSFVSLMNYHRSDYVMCHLLRRARTTGCHELRVDVLGRMAGPMELLSRPVIQSVQSYCRDFGRLVTSSGAALDMISSAQLTVRLRPESKGEKQHDGQGQVTATMRIVDDRGRAYIGRESESYSCDQPR
jgi:hypothetical protein